MFFFSTKILLLHPHPYHLIPLSFGIRAHAIVQASETCQAQAPRHAEWNAASMLAITTQDVGNPINNGQLVSLHTGFLFTINSMKGLGFLVSFTKLFEVCFWGLGTGVW